MGIMIIELTANLSATVVGGRYNINMIECPITKDTPKTYTIKKRQHSVRINKSSLMKVESDFNNSSIHRLQFRIVALKDEYEEAMKLLSDALESKLKDLQTLAQFAIDAFEDGPDLTKN